MKKRGGWVFVVLFLLLTTGTLFAEEPATSPFQISGFVDTYYSFNFNRPDSNRNTIAGTSSNFDFFHNAFSLSTAEVVFLKTAEPVGFRVDLDFGATTDFVHGGPIGAHPGTHPVTTESETYKNIQQAYLTWVTPIGLTLDMGKFVTHMGAEVIESKDNWNYTRSLLFCCAIPYYHAGLRASYPVADWVYINGYVLNGWNNVFENNNGKTFGAQIGITPIKQLPIILNWVGPEDGLLATENLHVYDVVATLNLTDQFALMLNYDLGTGDALATGESQSYSGIAAYARWMADPIGAAVRYEIFDDDDGIVFAVPGNTVQEITLTGEYRVASALLIRLEYRHDRADEEIFEDEGGGVTDTQNRVIAGVVYTF